MFRKIIAACTLLVSVAGFAWAANAPVYTDATGIVRSASGVIVVNPDGSFPIMGGSGGAGGGGGAVTGDVNSGATDTGTAPVKTGGVYNSTRPTFTTGQRGDTQIDSRGNTGMSIFGADNNLGAGVSASGATLPTTSASINTHALDYVYDGSVWQLRRGDATGAYAVGNVGDAATDSGNPLKIGGVYQSTLPTYTAGQRGSALIGSRGSLHTEIWGSDAASAVTVQTQSDGVSNATIGLTTRSMGYAYNGTTWDRVRGDTNGIYANGNVASGATDAGNPVKVGGRYNTAAPTLTNGQRGDLQLDVNGQLKNIDSASVAALNTANTYLSTIATNSGDTNPATVVLTAPTTGGCTPFHGTSAASTNSTAVKAAAAGTLCSLQLVNTTGTIYFFRMYDLAAAPTCSSATGAVHSWPIPASASGAGVAIPIGPYGEAFANGIGFCITGGGADTDNTNAAVGVYYNGSYK